MRRPGSTCDDGGVRWPWNRSPGATAPVDALVEGPHAPAVLPPVVGVRDPEVARQLDRDGYARLGPLLSPDEVAQANAAFAEAFGRLGQDVGERWFPTILLPDDDVRAAITESLSAIVVPHLHEVLDLGALDVVRMDYSVKPPSDTSELGPHQDFALVDEHAAQSLYLWIPLCDTDEGNGTLHVVPGSQHFTNRVRSRHLLATFDAVLDQVHDASVRLDCQAGELVVMVSGVVHHSPPNRSGHLRLAAHGIVKPAAAPLVLYYADDDTEPGLVECYELDIEDYVRAIHQGRPAGRRPDRLVPRPQTDMAPDRFAAGLAARPFDHRER